MASHISGACPSAFSRPIESCTKRSESPPSEKEAILRLHPCRIEHLLEEAFDTFAIAVAGGDRLLCCKAQGTIVDFARWQPRDIRGTCVAMMWASVRPLAATSRRRTSSESAFALKEGMQPLVVADDCRPQHRAARARARGYRGRCAGQRSWTCVSCVQRCGKGHRFRGPPGRPYAVPSRSLRRGPGPAATRRSPSSHWGRDRRVRRRHRHRQSLAPSSSAIDSMPPGMATPIRSSLPLSRAGGT